MLMLILIKKRKNTGAQPGGSIVAPPAGHGVNLVVPYPCMQPALASTSSGLGEGFSLVV